MANNARLYKEYTETIRPELAKELNVKSVMETPKIEKITINMGLGKAVNDKSLIAEGIAELTAIAGQQAVSTIARQSNASFKIREGMPIGVKVTLRGEKMYDFLDKLITISLPRIRDFRGVSHKAFDGRGNYTLGIKEHIIFPEVDLDKTRLIKGMDINIVTSAKNNEDAYKLLAKFGMPFANMKRGEN